MEQKLMDQELDTRTMMGASHSADTEKGNGSADTETSESDATARYDYTGMYRLSMMYDESSLRSSMVDLEAMGGFIALRPVMGDEYNVAIAIHEHSTRILTARLNVTQCMDYVFSSSLDQDHEIPYDDIIGVKNIKWMTKGGNDSSTDTKDEDATAASAKEQIEHDFVAILTKCDMIRFVGENLVLEGPKGAIECLMME